MTNMHLDLTIDKELLKYLEETQGASTEIKFKIGVIMDHADENNPKNWTVTLIPADTADTAALMVNEGEAEFVTIENRSILVFPIAKSGELNGGHIAWGKTPPKLMARATSGEITN